MKYIRSHEDLDVLKNVRVQINGRTVTVVGPRGKLTKSFDHVQMKLFFVNNHKTIRAEVWKGNRAERAIARTIVTHIRNMMIGVTRGFLYKMKLVANHFPISILQEGKNLEIRNFLGEQRVRYLPLPEGVSYLDKEKTGDKDEIHFVGNDVDAVSQTCANLHQLTLVKNKDIRKFLDGIYISARSNVVDEFDA